MNSYITERPEARPYSHCWPRSRVICGHSWCWLEYYIYETSDIGCGGKRSAYRDLYKVNGANYDAG